MADPSAMDDTPAASLTDSQSLCAATRPTVKCARVGSRLVRAYRGMGRLAIAFVVASAGFALAEATTGEAPEHISFVAKTPLLDAHGHFGQWSFTKIEIDPENPGASYVELTIDVTSVDTGNDRRDAHLRREDFFDVERYPTAVVRVQDVSPDGTTEAGNPKYRATVLMTIRGIQKPVPGSFEITNLSPPTVRGSLVVNRLDFGIWKPKSRWNPMSIDETIPMQFEVVVPVEPTTGESRIGS